MVWLNFQQGDDSIRKQAAQETMVTSSNSILIPNAFFLGQNRVRHMQSTWRADAPRGHALPRDETKTRKKRRNLLTDANQPH